jgi:hypothetical protein
VIQQKVENQEERQKLMVHQEQDLQILRLEIVVTLMKIMEFKIAQEMVAQIVKIIKVHQEHQVELMIQRKKREE